MQALDLQNARIAAQEAVRKVRAAKDHLDPASIDLILRDKDELVFVEVKKARSHAQAAERVTPRQVGRILRSASDYLRGEPAGQMTPCRVDVALVDVFGRVEILHNALAA